MTNTPEWSGSQGYTVPQDMWDAHTEFLEATAVGRNELKVDRTTAQKDERKGQGQENWSELG